jgi:hypothetical protein
VRSVGQIFFRGVQDEMFRVLFIDQRLTVRTIVLLPDVIVSPALQVVTVV